MSTLIGILTELPMLVRDTIPKITDNWAKAIWVTVTLVFAAVILVIIWRPKKIVGPLPGLADLFSEVRKNVEGARRIRNLEKRRAHIQKFFAKELPFRIECVFGLEARQRYVSDIEKLDPDPETYSLGLQTVWSRLGADLLYKKKDDIVKIEAQLREVSRT